MVTNFNHSLQLALQHIEHHTTKKYLIHPRHEARTLTNTDQILEKYADAKHQIINHINQYYQTNHNHDNWLTNQPDDVAHFLNEAGSNTLNYSEFKTPHKFHLHLGTKGFIIGIEQLGQAFNAQYIYENKIKQNQGKAFTFYNNSESTVFFNHPTNTTIVYLQFLF